MFAKKKIPPKQKDTLEVFNKRNQLTFRNLKLTF